jgi:hypothetical protein
MNSLLKLLLVGDVMLMDVLQHDGTNREPLKEPR